MIDGPRKAVKMVESLIVNGGGVMLVDEAYQLVKDRVGKQILDLLLKKMESHMDRFVVIFAGYKEEMESFVEHNPGLASRILRTFNFPNLTESELWTILTDNIKTQLKDVQVQGGFGGRWMRIAIRRLASNSSSRTCGNARAVENLVSQIFTRQARRLQKLSPETRQRRCKTLTKKDIIGPDPTTKFENSQAWMELQKMIGLDAVKSSIKSMIALTKRNYIREISETQPWNLPLNQLFVGNPGTGKTTVASLYGRILVDIGLLSKGDGKFSPFIMNIRRSWSSSSVTDELLLIVVIKSPADFIGSSLGESEEKTQKIIDSTEGRVLVIDEAYMLDAGNRDKDNGSYKEAVIDTIVANVAIQVRIDALF